MGNETEKDFQHQQPKPTGTDDPSKKNPSHQSPQSPNQQDPQSPNQQDPSKKVPSRGDGSHQHEEEEGSEQTDQRRVS